MKPSSNLSVLLAGLLLATSAMAADPLRLLSTTPLPDVSGGDFDHFDVDLKRGLLYVPTEEYGSIEVFGLPDGRRLRSDRTLARSPHKLLLAHGGEELWIADAGAAILKIADTTSFKVTHSIPLEAQPDSGIVDEKRGVFYLGNGGKTSEDHAYISRIALADHAVLGRIAVPAKQVKAMAIDAATDCLFVNFRDRNEIGIIDLASGKMTGIWQVPGPSRNSALAFDARTNRLFVGSRKPGKLYVLDAADGKVVQTMDSVDTSDEIIVDDVNRRVYIAGAGGLDVVSARTPDHYVIEQHIDTLGGKTAQYVPSLHRLYVVHTKGPQAAQAGLQVFEVR
jgi:DNA-binding beta-propeller fold protein YncE